MLAIREEMHDADLQRVKRLAVAECPAWKRFLSTGDEQDLDGFEADDDGHDNGEMGEVEDEMEVAPGLPNDANKDAGEDAAACAAVLAALAGTSAPAAPAAMEEGTEEWLQQETDVVSDIEDVEKAPAADGATAIDIDAPRESTRPVTRAPVTRGAAGTEEVSCMLHDA